jgi:hypothetical protein
MPEAAVHEIGDPVPKVDNEVAVGEDLQFQRRWWSFERIVMIVFFAMIALDLLGAFGRGVLARAHAPLSQGAADVKYERVERAGTPSILSIAFHEPAVRDGKVELWVDGALTKDLGTQRIIPQPATSTIDNDGIRYVFPVKSLPAGIQFALQPFHPGIYALHMRVEGRATDTFHIVVMP